MSACAVCGSENPSGKRFCKECGRSLNLACPSCRATVEPDSRFCGDCGAALEGRLDGAGEVVGAPLAPGTQVAERRVCSVLFADLVGFTPFSESRDPEEVRELLSVYFDRAKTIIVRYGGIVEKFIGDAVMAVWGTPVATEGDPERAVRAALDVVAAVAELGGDLGAPGFAARAGVVTGEVAVTLGLGGEGVAGDAVNTAARVQSVAPAGSVWVDSSTYRLAGAAIGFADVGEHELKGKAEPVRLWAATRVLSGVGGAQRVDGLEAPLVGHATRSCGRSRHCSTPAPSAGRPASWWWQARPGWANPGSGGSSRSTSTDWSTRSTGTGDGASPTGKAWPSGP